MKVEMLLETQSQELNVVMNCYTGLSSLPLVNVCWGVYVEAGLCLWSTCIPDQQVLAVEKKKKKSLDRISANNFWIQALYSDPLVSAGGHIPWQCCSSWHVLWFMWHYWRRRHKTLRTTLKGMADMQHWDQNAVQSVREWDTPPEAKVKVVWRGQKCQMAVAGRDLASVLLSIG